MRINIYAEEITTECEIVEKLVTDDCPTCKGHGVIYRDDGSDSDDGVGCEDCFGGGKVNHRTFYGIRMFLDSPDSLHCTPEDDDRSAITFWVLWTKATGHQWSVLADLFNNLYTELETVMEVED